MHVYWIFLSLKYHTPITISGNCWAYLHTILCMLVATMCVKIKNKHSKHLFTAFIENQKCLQNKNDAKMYATPGK